ncbi:MFS transporter [Gracilibacillus suaedae]|uniref:MFS transporter n=1 Tax=Gracilibacillus suaedae TaxID=2820273 RepID=UPI001ABE6FC8|nr:MFS transporter [Gracilibacillus suaedae]
MKRKERKTNHISSQATWREWSGLIVLMLPLFMLATDISVLYLAMPSISADLIPSSSQMLWILHIGEFLSISFVLTMGRLADRIGRRKLLIFGVSIYGIGSAFAAFALNPEMLIALRALLGIATATVMPASMALLRNMFVDQKQFSFAIALYISTFSAGSALGPPLGGFLVEYFWWGAAFLANIPFAALFLMFSWLLPTYRDRQAKNPDHVSVAFSLVSILGVIYGFQQIAENGIATTYIVSIAVGMIFGWLFIKRQQQLTDPLLDLNLFKFKTLSISLLAMLLIVLTFTAPDMLFAQYLQGVTGFSTAIAGLLLIFPALTSVIGTMIAPVLTKFFQVYIAMTLGVLVAIGGACIVIIGSSISNVPLLLTGVSLIGLGGGPIMTLGSDLIVSSAPMKRTSSASALTDVATGFGSGISIALLGSIATIIYRFSLNRAETDGVPSEAMNIASENIGSAMGIADSLPTETGMHLLHLAQNSFTLGMQVVYAITIVLMILTAFFILRPLKNNA